MIGQVFGRLTVVRFSHSNNGRYWLCACSCGGENVVRTSILRSGAVASCGCGSRDASHKNIAASAVTRTLPFPHPRKLKDLYRNMIDRCTNPANKRFANYGGRGIEVCDAWLQDRHGFYKWATENGYEPGLTIDREDVHGNYEPGNCRFVDAVTQQNNTTRNHFVEWQGERLTIAQWEARLGWPRGRLQARFNLGWTVERAMTQAPRRAPVKAAA